jgi:hypothetical protein
MITRYPI